MKLTIEGKEVNIPDQEIAKLCKSLEISSQEAVDLWLCDNGYEVNSEQLQLDEKAKRERVIPYATSDKSEKTRKPHVTKISDEKQALFAGILANLQEKYAENVKILKENKLIEVKIGEKTFKVDLIEQRPPKNK